MNNEKLPTAISAKLHAVNTKITRHISKTIQEQENLRLPEWRVATLLANAGPMSQSQIGALIGMDKGQISRTVKTMMANGLIAKNHDSLRPRKAPLSLTKYGREVHKSAASTIDQLNAELLSRLAPEEQHAICNILDVIEKSVDGEPRRKISTSSPPYVI